MLLLGYRALNGIISNRRGVGASGAIGGEEREIEEKAAGGGWLFDAACCCEFKEIGHLFGVIQRDV